LGGGEGEQRKRGVGIVGSYILSGEPGYRLGGIVGGKVRAKQCEYFMKKKSIRPAHEVGSGRRGLGGGTLIRMYKPHYKKGGVPKRKNGKETSDKNRQNGGECASRLQTPLGGQRKTK